MIPTETPILNKTMPESDLEGVDDGDDLALELPQELPPIALELGPEVCGVRLDKVPVSYTHLTLPTNREV